MPSDATDVLWELPLREVCVHPELVVLALRAFGVSSKTLQKAFGIDSAQLQARIDAGLTLAQETLPRVGGRYPFDFDPVGLADLKRLLDSGSSDFRQRELKFSEAPSEYIYNLVVVDEKPMCVPDPVVHTKLSLNVSARVWFSKVRRLFLRKTPCTELLILLPLPCSPEGFGNWSLFAPKDRIDGRDGALRVLAGLCSLGLTHRGSGHRTLFMSDLVKNCEALFANFCACGVDQADQPEDVLLRRQMHTLAEGLLLMRPDKAVSQVVETPARPLTLDFSQAWSNSPHRFSDWSIRDRAADADEVADAMLWLFAKTSGICLHITLESRVRADNSKSRDVRVLGPEAWIDFMRRGHGAKRGKESFEPYRLRDREGQHLICVDEPSRFKRLKKRHKMVVPASEK